MKRGCAENAPHFGVSHFGVVNAKWPDMFRTLFALGIFSAKEWKWRSMLVIGRMLR